MFSVHPSQTGNCCVIDAPAHVLHVVTGVVNVDAVILVGEVSLQLVPGISVDPQLVIDLLQGPLHLVLAGLYVVNFSHQRVLNAIIHHVDTLPTLSIYI